MLKDIIESGEVDREKSLVVTTRVAGATEKRYKEKSMHQMVVDNDRVKGITENKDGFRPHQGGKSKSGISELGRILKPEASKTGTVTASHAPKMLVDRDKSYCIDANYYKGGNLKSYFEKHRRQLVFKASNGKNVVVKEADLQGLPKTIYEDRTEEGKKYRKEYREKTG
ncbi:MAG: hypothetical protein GY814_18695, partial [Gammaproteobacteria bacterium]|nr:hypothetical protein [Gammaproteobacteria bacterium]